MNTHTQTTGATVHMTGKRKRIIEVLRKSQTGLSAREIYKRLKGEIDLVTIYRNLELFVNFPDR